MHITHHSIYLDLFAELLELRHAHAEPSPAPSTSASDTRWLAAGRWSQPSNHASQARYLLSRFHIVRRD